MAAKRSKKKNTLSGLRSLQTLGSIVVPGTLEEVPEEVEPKVEISSKKEIFGTDDWKSVERAVNDIFSRTFLLTEYGLLFRLHQNVKNILRSRTGTFLYDCYKEWVSKELNIQARKISNLEDSELLNRLEEAWIDFYRDSLPMLEAVFYLLKPKGRLSMRGTSLLLFRDIIFFSENVEAIIRTEHKLLNPEIKHMILILYNVNDSYPPSKNKLRLESVAARVCSSFMGYFGLYEDGELVVPSNEPAIAVRRRPSDVGPRRISRPFSVQPQQLETLNQLFKNAVRHKSTKKEGPKGNFQKNTRTFSAYSPLAD